MLKEKNLPALALAASATRCLPGQIFSLVEEKQMGDRSWSFFLRTHGCTVSEYKLRSSWKKCAN
jgi:hypothetical protein